jgi:RHS repeat-associated protein
MATAQSTLKCISRNGASQAAACYAFLRHLFALFSRIKNITTPAQSIARCISLILGILTLTLSITSQAGSLLPILSKDAYPVSYQTPTPDLSVKVWGGSIVIQTGYADAGWYPNLNWLPIKIVYDSVDGTVKTLTRGHSDYSKVAPGVYQDLNFNILRQTASGFRWNDKNNNWIEYNPAGEIKTYGDRNGTIATFVYTAGTSGGTGTPPSEGNISGILDHFGTQVLWFDYDPATSTLTDHIIRIRDASGRKVEYTWTAYAGGSAGNSSSISLSVLDANNNTWTYTAYNLVAPPPSGSLGSIGGGGGGGGGGSAISVPPPPPDSACLRADGPGITLTDPLGHATSRAWYHNGALALTTYADGSSLCVIQDYDPAKSVFYNREIETGTDKTRGKLTETWSELTQDINRGEILRRDINGITVETQKLDSNTHTTTVTDARGLNTAITRDQWKNITKVVAPDGSTATTNYDPLYSNVTQSTDENGTITQYSYDANGNLTKVVAALGLQEQRSTEYTVDANGYRRKQTVKGDANTPDAVTLYDNYDNAGNVGQITDPEGGITTYTYDVAGNVLTMKNARGKTVTATYDNRGNLLTFEDALKHKTTVTYDTAGMPQSIQDPVGNISLLGFDAVGRILTVTDPYGAITSLGYDVNGNPSSMTDSEKHTEQLSFDLDGRPIKYTDGNKNVTQFQYGDAASGLNRLLTKVIYPTFSQDYTYDNRDRVTQASNNIDAGTQQTTAANYDNVGNLTKITDAASRSTATAYNAYGQVTQTTDAKGGITYYTYDARGNLSTVKDAMGNTHTFTYDKLDRMVKEARPLGQTISYAYDAVGNLTQVTDPKGQVNQYVYDDANRRTEENHYLNATDATAQTNAAKSIIYSYNNLDRLTGYNDGSSTGTYTYDTKQLRRTGESVNYGSFSLSASTSWNSLGLKSGINYPDGASYTYTYDANNQIATVNLPTGYGSLTWNSYNWVAPSQITLPGGTVRKQGYDNLLRLKTIDVTDPTQNPVMNYQYGYDATDNITSKITALGTTGYGYDELDRLISATPPAPQTAETYTYDAVTNRVTDAKVSGPLVYNANNQLTSAGSITYDYDANGNTIKQTDSNNAANTRNYVYDTNDRLIEVRNNSNNLIAVYSYDPFGRRLSKDAGTSKTYFFYTDEGLIAEADATGTVNKTYGYAPGSAYMTNPLFMKYGISYYYYQNDHLGTPMKLISQSGQEVWSATYDAFGNATTNPAYTLVNNLRFPGQYYDQETGLHNNWMRYYNSATGRYITSDPIGLSGGINMYAYVGGDPLSFIDPLGLLVVTVNYGSGPYSSTTLVWNSWVPSYFGRSGSIGGHGTEINSGIYKYSPVIHSPTNPNYSPYRALQITRKNAKKWDTNVPATRKDGHGNTANGIHFHKGNLLTPNTLSSGSEGCHVVPSDQWNKFISNFGSKDEGTYIYFRLDDIPSIFLCPVCYIYTKFNDY